MKPRCFTSLLLLYHLGLIAEHGSCGKLSHPVLTRLHLSSQLVPYSIGRKKLHNTSPLWPIIVNGEDAPGNEALYQVQVRQESLFGETFCGGSVIAPHTIITAAHCVSWHYWSWISIRYGTHQLDYSPYEDVWAREVHIHPEYDSNQFNNDIAVVKLSGPISPGANVQFIELERKALPAASLVSIYGWGKQHGSDDSQPEWLQKATLTTLRDDDCRASLRASGITANVNVICAISPNQSACQGDSGGPMQSPDGLLAGVAVAVENGCPEGGLNIFTKVSAYVDWIESLAD